MFYYETGVVLFNKVDRLRLNDLYPRGRKTRPAQASRHNNNNKQQGDLVISTDRRVTANVQESHVPRSR